MSIVDRAREEIRSMRPYRSARREGVAKGVLLNANESPFPAPGYPEPPLNRYPDPQPRELARRMAEVYDVDPEQILVTRGSDEAIDLVVRAFCRAYRDSLLYCPPTFGMYRIAGQTQGAGLIEVPLATEDFALDVRGIQAALEERDVRVIFLCSPNNPTGNRMDREAMRDVVEAARDQALVVVDEAYLEFSGADSLAAEIRRYENLAVLRTLSKAYALAGARCGALIARPGVVRLLARIMAPYPVPDPVRRAAEAALAPQAADAVCRQVRTIVAQRERLEARLGKLSFVDTVYPSDANFLLVRITDAPALLEQASRKGILLRDMSGYPGLQNCIRISAGSEDEMNRLYAFLEAFDGR